jgi:EAL domain-containing protein (putative c-di-GMP-specific phosphodiesterase class I)
MFTTMSGVILLMRWNTPENRADPDSSFFHAFDSSAADHVRHVWAARTAQTWRTRTRKCNGRRRRMTKIIKRLTMDHEEEDDDPDAEDEEEEYDEDDKGEDEDD